jgi:hypothetical protein
MPYPGKSPAKLGELGFEEAQRFSVRLFVEPTRGPQFERMNQPSLQQDRATP